MKVKLCFWGAVGGAIVAAIIGFSWGGWVTGSNAQKMIEDAVVSRLTPICVEQFNRDPEKGQKLKNFKKEESWKRDDYVEKQGWATMPGEKKPDSKVAKQCVTLLMKLGQ